MPNLYYRTDRAVDFSMERMQEPGMLQVMLGKVRTLTMTMMLADTKAILPTLPWSRWPDPVPLALSATA